MSSVLLPKRSRSFRGSSSQQVDVMESVGVDRPHRFEVLAETRSGVGERGREAPRDVGPHLGPEADDESSVRRLGEHPGRLGRQHRVPWEGHGDAGPEGQRRRGERRRGAHREDRLAPFGQPQDGEPAASTRWASSCTCLSERPAPNAEGTGLR